MSQICEEIHEWIEEEIEKPVDEWIEKEVRKCKRKKCRKWCLCCNKWFCWIETVVVRVVKWIVITVGKWVTRTVCEIGSIAVDAIGGILGLVLAIPVIGRLIRQLWDLIQELVWRLIGLPGLLLDVLGVDWEKKLRICIIILREEKGVLATAADLDPAIQTATRIWAQAANVRLIVEDVHEMVDVAPDRNLDVHCDFGSWLDDVWLPGSWFEVAANTYCFDGAGRRIHGLFSPVVVFAVRDVEGKRGCSLGPFADYVVIEAGDPSCLAHELAHACGGWHHDERDNLLFSSCGGTRLKTWQKRLLRNSRHVSYL